MIMKTIFAHNILRELVYDFHAFFGLVFSVAYLECAKGGGPGGLFCLSVCPSVCLSVPPSVTLCIVAKRCVLEQKLLLRAYRKSYMRNRLVPK